MKPRKIIRCMALFAALLVLVPQAAPARASGTVLYEKTSAYGTIVVTDEGDGMRALRFGRDGVRQSVVKLGDPEYLGLAYTPVALVGLALCAEPRRILVVGLGGGTLPAFLRRYYPDAEIDAVDVDPEVAFVAKEYFGFREDERMHIHVADGRRFVEEVRRPYDVIFLDAFGAEAVPVHLTTAEFLSAVRRALRPDGVVVGNIWSSAANPLYDSMVRTYRATFDGLYVLRVASTNNRILLALPRRQPLSRSEIADMARKVSAEKRFRFDPGILVDRGLIPAGTSAIGGQVLRDADMVK
ncbi:MAG: fused MFS/spermidine synthase [Burkholderiales bacterium]|nr:fused MFS/spermidine synthase [Burkholderiales bacterium]